MKILTILGSPRRKGNTAAVLAKFEEMAKGEHSVDRINIVDYDVRGCLGCDFVLQKPGRLRAACKKTTASRFWSASWRRTW